MNSQIPAAKYWRNTSTDIHYDLEDYRIKFDSKKIPVTLENKTHIYGSLLVASYNTRTNAHFGVSPLFYQFENCARKLKSLKSEALILNPYQFKDLFKEEFLKTLFTGTCNTNINIEKNETFCNERNISKQIFSIQNTSSSHLKKLACLFDGSKKSATWKQPVPPVLNQSKHISGGFSELSVDDKKYMNNNVFVVVKTAVVDNGVSLGNENSVIFKETTKNKTSSKNTTLSKQVMPTTTDDSYYSKEKYTLYSFERAIFKQILHTIKDGSNILENEMFTFEKADSKQISSMTQEDSRLSNELETSPFKFATKLPIVENESKMCGNKKFIFEKAFSELILLIMQDNHNSDLRNLEEEVNYFHPSSNADLLQSVQNSSRIPTSLEYSLVYSWDDYLSKLQRNEYSCNEYQQTQKNNEESEDLKLIRPKSRRSRENSGDSGICLDSIDEGILPEPSKQESDCSEDACFSAYNIPDEFVSGLNSTFPSHIDDCSKVCNLCNMVILKKSVFVSRFGLLLNCFDSFCYSCIYYHSKLGISSSGLVKCPKCGINSPGIVASSRWIKEKSEKMVLFLRRYGIESIPSMSNCNHYYKNFR